MSLNAERPQSRELSPAEFLADIEVAVTDRMTDPINPAGSQCRALQRPKPHR